MRQYPRYHPSCPPGSGERLSAVAFVGATHSTLLAAYTGVLRATARGRVRWRSVHVGLARSPTRWWRSARYWSLSAQVFGCARFGGLYRSVRGRCGGRRSGERESPSPVVKIVIPVPLSAGNEGPIPAIPDQWIVVLSIRGSVSRRAPNQKCRPSRPLAMGSRYAVRRTGRRRRGLRGGSGLKRSVCTSEILLRDNKRRTGAPSVRALPYRTPRQSVKKGAVSS